MEEERGPRCGIENCRSRRYHLGEDGYRYCSNGHRAETQVATQDEDFITAVSRRTRKRAETGDSVTTVFEGRQAVELYLQCFQLILWKQIFWLVHNRHYPPELELVTRELWALRLQMLKNVFKDTQETERFFSSQQSETEDDNESPGVPKFKIKKLEAAPKLIETLGLCYIGLILLRLPIMASDVRDWVLDDDFTYLKAFRTIPAPMKQRLPTTLRRAFQVQTGILELGALQEATMNIAATFQNTFGMEIPPVNHPLLAFRFQTVLCLPLQILPAIDRLQMLLNLTYTFPFPLQKYTLLSAHPELKLLTLIIIVTKLFYPFDSTIRHPTEVSEPAALAVDWKVWNELYHQHQQEQPVKSQRMNTNFGALEVQEKDVFDMSKKEIDDYLNWFASTWIEKDDEGNQGPDADFQNALHRMFPIDETKHSHSHGDDVQNADFAAQTQRIRSVQASLIPVKTLHKNGSSDKSRSQVLRPGSQYKHYRDITEIPDVGKPFFEAAAGLVNLNVKQLVLAVFQMEMKLQRWVRQARKDGENREDIGDDDVDV